MKGSFTKMVEGWSHEVDTGEIRRALTLLFLPGEHREIRSLPGGDGGVGDIEYCAALAVKLANRHVYYTLNPVEPGSRTANGKTVTGRRWLLIDIDTVRPGRDTNATEGEKAAAFEVATNVALHLIERGWPHPVIVDSGNGWHLLYRIDLPNNEHARQVIRGVLDRLAKEFSTPEAFVDPVTHDAPRIAKLPGTWARKGPHSDERPHRMCRIHFDPADGEVVPAELLKAVASGPDAGADPGPVGPSSFSKRAEDGGDRMGAYVRRAVDGECYRMATAIERTRNDTLNRCAFVLGTMAGWPEMDGADARARLSDAARQAGLPETEIAYHLPRSWEAGALQPRTRPVLREDAAPKADPKPAPDGEPARLIRFASEVDPKKVAWVWKDRIAEGFITVFAGKTGIGKSFVLCDLAAKLTTGRLLPVDAEERPPCNVLFISEDPVEYVLVPRLMKLGAALDRMAFMTWDAMGKYTLRDTDMLEVAWEQAGRPRLIIFDPPANFLGGANEHRNSEIREVVMKVVTWMDGKGVASVFVIHLNRRLDKGVEALDRIMGSVAWGSTSRVAMGLASDPNKPGTCLFAGIKSNLGPRAATLAYRIVPSDDLAVVEWDGEVDISADDALGAVKKKSRGLCALEWLAERFRERPSWESEELFKAAAEAGHSRSSMFSPEVNALPIRKRKTANAAGEPCWMWMADPGWPPQVDAKDD